MNKTHIIALYSATAWIIVNKKNVIPVRIEDTATYFDDTWGYCKARVVHNDSQENLLVCSQLTTTPAETFGYRGDISYIYVLVMMPTQKQ